MQTFSIKQSLQHGWTLFKNNKKVLILSTLILLVTNSWQRNDTERGHVRSDGEFIIGVILFVVSFVVQVGWLKSLLKIEAGERSRVRELFAHHVLFVKYLVVSFLYGAMVTLGTILFIIPGIYVALRFCFAPVIAVDSGRSIIDSFKESSHMTEGIKWKLLGFFVVLGLVNILGLAALVVGLLVTVPVTSLAYLHVYRLIKNRAS